MQQMRQQQQQQQHTMELWIDCRACAVDAESSAGLPSGCDRLLLKKGSGAGPFPAEANLVWEDSSGRLLDATGRAVGAAYAGAAAEAQARALAAIGSAEWVLLEVTDAAVCVPAENLIAAGRAAGTRVAVVATSAQQIAGLAGALQLGVDALVIPADAKASPGKGYTGPNPAPELWKEALSVKETRHQAAASSAKGSHEAVAATATQAMADADQMFSAARVTSVETVGSLGDRVCLDLIQLMREGEGALVGSTAKALCVVLAETAQTGLVPPRPFRVNAGPVHAYVALADGRTKYLSEIDAGDEILVVDAAAALAGQTLPCRRIAVGRCKTEPRPVLCVRFSDGERSGQLLLQQAETVRILAQPGGGDAPATAWAPRAVTALEAGDALLVRWADQGTHVGRRIAATVAER
mmetsp:Transcript_56885/g.157423  ORF Transcript_56885/g.157423 Transcript_56885/m.157423 type:complete len:410 (-) Transcript_56885:116-1345(-)